MMKKNRTNGKIYINPDLDVIILAAQDNIITSTKMEEEEHTLPPNKV